MKIKTLYGALLQTFSIYFFLCIQLTREASAKYYKKTKKRFKRLVKDIKILLKRKTPKKREYGPEPYKNLSENEKQKLVGIIVVLLKGIKKCGKVT